MLTRLLIAALAGGTVLAAAPAQAADYNTLTSFDGTPITFYWFPAVGLAPGQTAPTVLQGPGFGGQAKSDPDAPDGGALPGIGPLRQAGYNVLTWNPRGISPSGGEAMLDNPDYEGRDVQALIDWVGKQPEAQLDAPGDPRVGMTGGSYGGGIQFSTAVIDSRLDAIVPVIAWNSLGTSLYRNDTIKTAWVNVLMAGATRPGNTFSPEILKGRAQARDGMTFSDGVVDFARSAGPAQFLAGLETPTFIIQGTVDNLFPPSEALANYRTLNLYAGVPLKMTWYCGGHGFCLTSDGATQVPLEQTWAWLDKYLKGNAAVDTGPAFTWVDQNGTYRSAASVPTATRWETATGKGTLRLKAKGGSGPYTGELKGVNPLTAVLLRQTIPTPAKNAVQVQVKAKSAAVIMGTPKLTLKYRGTAPGKKHRVLAQLVDVKNNAVVGHQITPVPLRLNGRPQTLKLPLEAVSVALRKGQRLRLQIVAQSSAYNVFPQGGSVTLSKVRVKLPVVG